MGSLDVMFQVRLYNLRGLIRLTLALLVAKQVVKVLGLTPLWELTNIT